MYEDTPIADYLEIAFKQLPGRVADVRAKCMDLAHIILKRCEDNHDTDRALEALRTVVLAVDESRRMDSGLKLLDKEREEAERPNPATAPTESEPGE